VKSLTAIRQHLHRFPELSGQEYQTQKFIIEQLKPLKWDYAQKVASTGFLLGFTGPEEGPNILLRADIDALPIAEINNFAHRSLKEKESHKCGHDGHTAILIGVARHFSDNPPQRGAVYLLFQPAEETGQGAKAVLNDEVFRELSFHQCFALHNLPGFPMHQIICKPKQFSAGAISVAFRLFGKTSHAAEPEAGLNPSHALSTILALSKKYSQPQVSNPGFCLLTPVYATLGSKSYGVSAGYAEAHFTLRAFEQGALNTLCKQLSAEILDIATQHNLLLEEDWFEEFYANYNHPQAYELVAESAKELNLAWHEMKNPFRWTEDFGLFSSVFTGAMFGLGAGENTPALHSPDYDFPDELLETGVKMFCHIANQALETGNYEQK
jgi:amidohydrolase